MKTVLHVVTQPSPAAQTVLEADRNQPDQRVVVIDLTSGSPDYGQLVEQIFAADRVRTW